MRSKQQPVWTRASGFTLVEVLVVLAIVAILATLAVPTYRDAIRKSNRGEAQQLLMNWASLQEIWRANHTEYAPDDVAPNGIPRPPNTDNFTFSLDVRTATAYTLNATATGDQAKDRASGTPCVVMTLDQSNNKTPALCW